MPPTLKLVVSNRYPEVVRRRPQRPPAKRFAERLVEACLAEVERRAGRDDGVEIVTFTGGSSSSVGLSVHFLPGPPRKSTSQEIHAVRRAETRRGRPVRTP